MKRLALVALLLPVLALAQDSTEFHLDARVLMNFRASGIGLFPYNGAISNVLQDDRLYLSLGDWGLGILDVSDPQDIRPVFQSQLGFRSVGGVKVSGDRLYFISDRNLVACSLNDPVNPEVLDSVYIRENGYWFDKYEVFGETGLVSVKNRDDIYQIWLYDLSDPMNIRRVSVIENLYYSWLATPTRLAVSRRTWNRDIRDYDHRVELYDIADPAQPRALGTIIEDKSPWMVFDDDLLFINSQDSSYVFDVANADEIRRLPADNIRIRRSIIRNGLQYYVDPWGELHIFDLDDLENPVELGSYGSWGEIAGFTLSGDRFYVSTGSVLYVLDIGDPENIRELGHYRESRNVHYVTANEEIACVMDNAPIDQWDSNELLRIIDISDLTAPQPLGEYLFEDSISACLAVKVNGDWLYRLTITKLQTLDISDPADPRLIHSIEFDEQLPNLGEPGRGNYSIEIRGDRGYIVTLIDLAVLDLSDPAAPELIRWQERPDGGAYAIGSEYLYAVADGRMNVYDLDNLEEMEPVGGSDLPHSWMLDQYSICSRYITLRIVNQLTIIDITDPVNPRPTEVEINFFEEMWLKQCYATDDKLFTVDFEDKLEEYDMSDLDHPRWTGVRDRLMSQRENIDRIVVVRDTLLVAQETSLTILDHARNEPPDWIDVPEEVVGSEGEELSFNVVASDPNHAFPVLSLQEGFLPENARFVDNRDGSGTLTWTPDYHSAGEYQAVFEARDDWLTDTASVRVTILNVNVPPGVLHPLPDVRCSAGDSLIVIADLDTVFSSPDDDSIFFQITRPENGSGLFLTEDSRLWLNPAETLPDSHFTVILTCFDTLFTVTDTFELFVESLGITEDDPLVLRFGIDGCYPNPFNSSLTVGYSLSEPGHYTIDIVDISGRLVTRLSDGWKEAGRYREVFSGSHLPSGQYLIQLNGTSGNSLEQINVIK